MGSHDIIKCVQVIHLVEFVFLFINVFDHYHSQVSFNFTKVIFDICMPTVEVMEKV